MAYLRSCTVSFQFNDNTNNMAATTTTVSNKTEEKRLRQETHKKLQFSYEVVVVVVFSPCAHAFVWVC